MPETTEVVESAIERFREWLLGGGRFKGLQKVPILASWSETTDHRFKAIDRRIRQWDQHLVWVSRPAAAPPSV